MTGYRTVIESFIALHEIPEAKLSGDHAYVTPRLAEAALREVAAARGLKLGAIVGAFDAHIPGIVSRWSVGIDGRRAVVLGLPTPPELVTLIGHYLKDFAA